MKKPTGKQITTLFLGPWMIIPTGFVFALLSLFIYGDPPEIHGHLERALFLQGNTDLGGGCLFAATVGLYATFGFTAAWYLVLKMPESTTARASFSRDLLKAIWFLKFHIIAYIIGGTANLSYDAYVTPNDFRNMFLLAGLIYLLSVFAIVGMNRLKIPLSARLALAPVLTIAWLIIGSDGNTSRAGQLVQSGQDPQPITRSSRHKMMLSWHYLCDSVLGNTRKRTT